MFYTAMKMNMFGFIRLRIRILAKMKKFMKVIFRSHIGFLGLKNGVHLNLLEK